jgi:PAS domain S-box-containing protein
MDSIITVDSDGNVVDLNPAAEAMFGHRRQTILGKRLECFIIPALSSDRQPRGLKQYITSDGNAIVGKRIEITAVKADGAEFPIELTITRVLSGAPPVFTAYIRDLSEQKAREQMRRRSEELERQNRYIQAANRLKSEFLANMSHELRTPLNAIIGFAELMHDAKVGPIAADHKEYLADILTSGRHLLLLINDVLDLSKVEAGKMELNPEPVDLESIVLEVRVSLHGLTAPKNLQLQTDIDRSLTGVVADRRRLKQVLYNYLSNAIKFTGEGGLVTLRIMVEDNDSFRLEVEDTGIGIAPGDIGKLFVEFQQLDNTESKKYPGTGLGLALTKRIVEMHGGNVGVNSVLGRGSVFFAVLPRVAAAERKDT